MKYQIYLNKETSELINTCATHDNIKPSTMIKQLLEGMFKIASETANATEKELIKYGKR